MKTKAVNRRFLAVSSRLRRRFRLPEWSSWAARVLLANTYASNGDFLKSSNIRMEMVESGLKKKISISKTVVNGQIHVSFTMKKRLNSNENCLFNLGIRSSR